MKKETKEEAEQPSGNAGDAEAPACSRSQPRPCMERAVLVMVMLILTWSSRVASPRAEVAVEVLGSLVLLRPAPSRCGRCGCTG